MASVVFVFGGHFGGPGGACGGGGFGSDDFEVAAFQVRFLAIGGFSWEAGGRGYADRFPGVPAHSKPVDVLSCSGGSSCKSGVVGGIDKQATTPAAEDMQIASLGVGADGLRAAGEDMHIACPGVGAETTTVKDATQAHMGSLTQGLETMGVNCDEVWALRKNAAQRLSSSARAQQLVAAHKQFCYLRDSLRRLDLQRSSVKRDTHVQWVALLACVRGVVLQRLKSTWKPKALVRAVSRETGRCSLSPGERNGNGPRLLSAKFFGTCWV